jgi:hypothetical protein
LALLTAVLVLFGAYSQVSGTSGVLTFPEAAWELSLGIYLIAKGFKTTSPVLDGSHHAVLESGLPIVATVAA